MRRLAPILIAAALALAAAGCATESRRGVPLLEAGSVRLVTEDGPWRPVPAEEEIGGPWRVAHGGFERPSARPEGPLAIAVVAPAEAASAALPVVEAPVVPAPTLAVPRRREAEEARPVGQRATKSPALLARDHFVDYPTHVTAQRATLYVPPDLAGRVALTGERVETVAPGRRQAVGGARLTLGELTLEADRVLLRVRDDGRDDLQVMARGGVEMVSEVRGNVLREQGLRSLLITNDQVVPLR